MHFWHSYTLETLFSVLSSGGKYGLSTREANLRLGKYGPNEIAEVKRDPWYIKLLLQFRSLPMLMLMVAALVSFALGFTVDSEKFIDGFAITVAILLAGFFGFFQEYRAERALEALKKMVVQRSLVIRDGRDTEIESRLLVPGDVVVLDEGSRVPADIRIIEAANLAANQSMLTGESHASEKKACALPEDAVLSDRKNMLFSGTIIVRGHCSGVVVCTGMSTEFGKIVTFVTEPDEPESALDVNINKLSKGLGYLGIFLAALFFIFGILQGESTVDMLVVAITLAVAVIPEGLPTVLAITLALGVSQMAKKNAIVRKMNAVEALGSATVICTDKTGTITQNRMVAQKLILSHKTFSSQPFFSQSEVKSDAVLCRAAEIMVMCNNSLYVDSNGKRELKGDPTETALLSAVESCLDCEKEMRFSHPQIAEVPFDSGRKIMSSIRSFGKKRIAFVKGAPERVLPLCTKMMSLKGESGITPAQRAKAISDTHSLGDEGMRVLALAFREIGEKQEYTALNTEESLTFVGLVAMEDPPRQEAKEAIALCKSAGVAVVMITGDSVSTAKAIASKVGLLFPGQKVIDSPELEAMSERELEHALPYTGVFARVAPEQKHRIVQAFMRKGGIVAVTGDGVNDAPAIKAANIGIAMGVSGTDVSKEVADIVLVDDNFASIVSAIHYGRVIYNNIRSFVRYQLSTNIAAISLMFSAPALSLPIPLIPLQILWINIMVDGPPAIALGAEPSTNTEMQAPPRNPKAGLINRELAYSLIFNGLLMGGISLAIFSFYLGFDATKATTAVFTLFVFLQLLNALNCRSAKHSVFQKFFANPWLLLAIGGSLLVHMAIVYYGPLQTVFQTVALSAFDMLILAWSALAIVLVEEIKKRYTRHITKY